MPNNADTFDCNFCMFKCSKKSNWEKHLLTAKHKTRTIEQVVKKTADKKLLHICNICNKQYNSRSALWYHKKNDKKCLSIETIKIENIDEKKNLNTIISNQETMQIIDLLKKNNELQQSPFEMINQLLKQNVDLQKQIIELSKEPKIVNNYTNNTNNTNTNNTTNNQFNLNMFLNEECKDALNIDDFMNSLKVTVEDLIKTGELGFVQGMTSIFLKGLKDLDITQRPIHCTDVKRETVYIKDKDKWEKETTEKKLLKQALNQVVRKNLSMLPEWREDHPDYLRSNTTDNDEYIKISLNSLGSEYDDEQQRMDEKILRNVLKEVVVDRKISSLIE
jgi:hypothetical protein